MGQEKKKKKNLQDPLNLGWRERKEAGKENKKQERVYLSKEVTGQ